MKNLVKEFKEFALGGNLIEVGVALVMALALAAVINSLVENVLMPIVGIIFGEPSFDNLTWTVNGSVIMYGAFIGSPPSTNVAESAPEGSRSVCA